MEPIGQYCERRGASGHHPSGSQGSPPHPRQLPGSTGDDEFDKLPAPFVRAFLRNTRYLDLDPDPLVQRNARHPGQDSAALGMGWTAAPQPERHWSRSPLCSWWALSIGVLAFGYTATNTRAASTRPRRRPTRAAGHARGRE